MIRGEKQQAAGRQHKEASKETNIIYLLHRWQRYVHMIVFFSLFTLRTLNEFGLEVAYGIMSYRSPVFCNQWFHLLTTRQENCRNRIDNKLSTNLQTNIGMPSYILENVQGAINHLHLTLYISRTWHLEYDNSTLNHNLLILVARKESRKRRVLSHLIKIH